MARVELPQIVLDPDDGTYVTGAEIDVQNRPSGTAANVYDAESGGSVITQPLTTDSQGRVTGWVARGRYQLVITYPDASTTTVYFDAATAEDGSIDATWIAANAVTTSKILDDAVTSGKIATDAVTSDAIVADAVGSTEIADGSVTVNKIGADAVDATKLKDDVATDGNRAVTTDHIRDVAVTAAKLASNAVTTTKIQDGAVTPAKLASSPYTRSLVAQGWCRIGDGLSGSTEYLFGTDGATVPILSAQSEGVQLWRLNTTDYNVSGFTNNYELRGTLVTNSTAWAAGFDLGIYRVDDGTGAADLLTVDASLAYTAVAFTPVAGNVAYESYVYTSGVTAGYYCFGINPDGAPSSGVRYSLGVSLYHYTS